MLFFFFSVFFLILSRHPSNPMIYSYLIASQIDNLFFREIILSFVVFFSFYLSSIFFFFKNPSPTAYSTTQSLSPVLRSPGPTFLFCYHSSAFLIFASINSCQAFFGLSEVGMTKARP